MLLVQIDKSKMATTTSQSLTGEIPANSISAIFRSRTGSIIYKNYKERREGMGQPSQQLLAATEKVWRVL